MKTDLDRILFENGLDGMLVVGAAMHNPAMVYLTGGGHITNADLIYPRGQKASLFVGPMERDEASKSGLNVRTYSSYPMADLLRQTDGDRFKAGILRYCRMLQDMGLTSGRVALYGRSDLGIGYSTFSALQEAMPNLTFVGDLENRVLQRAMMTKDAEEVERIREVGKATVEVVGRVSDLLTHSQVKENYLVQEDGQAVTIGFVKKKINLWLAECGVENPQGTIFAIGRDAGVPHSSGTSSDFIRLGKTIVFDIFPCEEGGGYFHDFTRTWCVGYAPDAELSLYEQVRDVFGKISSRLEAGKPFGLYQKLTCEMFEQMGHPTVLNTPQTDEGYVHSLGHGVGLNIHERPFSGTNAAIEDVLVPGSVITLEPGLYYPSRDMGVRLEDTLYVRPDGSFETLVDYPLDLVLPVKG